MSDTDKCQFRGVGGVTLGVSGREPTAERVQRSPSTATAEAGRRETIPGLLCRAAHKNWRTSAEK